MNRRQALALLGTTGVAVGGVTVWELTRDCGTPTLENSVEFTNAREVGAELAENGSSEMWETLWGKTGHGFVIGDASDARELWLDGIADIDFDTEFGVLVIFSGGGKPSNPRTTAIDRPEDSTLVVHTCFDQHRRTDEEVIWHFLVTLPRDSDLPETVAVETNSTGPTVADFLRGF